MDATVVSVILTVFKREQFLRGAIAETLKQTFPNWEIIVADDSNQPSLHRICESMPCGGRLRYRGNVTRLGAPGNIRAAVQEARGRYIAILNDDDFWGPTFLEKLVAPLEENPERVIAFSDHWIVRDDGTVDAAATDRNTLKCGRQPLPPGEISDPASLVLRKNGVPLAMASLFRKDALDWSLLTREVAGAYDFWIACLLAASNRAFYYVPERLTFYRVHAQMESYRKSPDRNLPMIFIYEQLLQRNWFPLQKNLLKMSLAEAFFRNGRELLWFGQASAARVMFWKAARNGRRKKAVMGFFLSLAPNFIRRFLKLSQ
jgi:glycosyltransferase involved in cell wall biosynthesis